MYGLINLRCAEVLAAIPKTHVAEYDWLMANLQQVGIPDYQAKYRNYWRMNSARLCSGFYAAYFEKFHECQGVPPDLASLVIALYEIPTQKTGRQSLQFSFATKFLHSLDNKAPIYDKLVARFYFFKKPRWNAPVAQRVQCFVQFHQFLQIEYARVIESELLAPSIRAFRDYFEPQHFTDEKVIDSLIWGYVSLLQ